MELFERVRYLSSYKGISLAKIAEHLSVLPQTFHQWLSAKSQKNLWEHLPKLVELFPGVNRRWLYMGEGEPFGEENPVPQELQAELARIRAELDEVNRINRQLTTRLLIDGAGDKDAQTNTAKTADGAK